MMRHRWIVWGALFGPAAVLLPQLANAQSSVGQEKRALPGIRAATIAVHCGEITAAASGDGQSQGQRAILRDDDDCPRDLSSAWLGLGDRLTIPIAERLFVSGGVDFDTAPSHAGFGRTWQAAASLMYRAPGGIDVSASVVGRRGYEMPLFMATALGSDASRVVSNSPILDATRRPVLWDTVLRVEREIFTPDTLRVILVGEVFNLVDLNRDQDQKPIANPLKSRVGRLRLRFKF